MDSFVENSFCNISFSICVNSIITTKCGVGYNTKYIKNLDTVIAYTIVGMRLHFEIILQAKF